MLKRVLNASQRQARRQEEEVGSVKNTKRIRKKEERKEVRLT